MTHPLLPRLLAALAVSSSVLAGTVRAAEETPAPAPQAEAGKAEAAAPGAPAAAAPVPASSTCKTGPALAMPQLPASKTQAKTGFALALLGAVAGDGKSNAAVSPFGVATVLASLDLGADPQMKASIAKTLALGAPKAGVGIEDLRRDARLLARIGEAADAPFSSAEAILVDRRLKLAPGIADTVAAETGVAIRPVDFAAKDTLEEINRWAAARTRGRIASILEPGDQIEFAAIQAFSFKDCWRYRFDPERTGPKAFLRPDGSKADRPTMALGGVDLAYGAAGKFFAVELPYADDRFVLTLVSAQAPTTLLPAYAAPEVQELIAGRGMKPTPVELALPKFTVQDQHNLNKPLEALGLSTSGGLPGFAADLKLSQVRQKTFIAADEAGTEAAAVTAALAARSMAPAPRQAVSVSFDHPFLFALRHRQTGSLLMVGWIADPNASE